MDLSKSLTKCVVDISPQQRQENNNNSDNNKYKLSGQLLFRKTNFKAFAEGRGPKCVYISDQVEYINGLPWKIELKWGGEHFGVHLRCEGDSNDMAWLCQAFCQFCIVSCTNDNKFFMHKGDFGNFNVHNAVNPSWGYANFAKFEEVMDQRNGLYNEKKDTVTFKAQVIAEKPRGMPELRTDDFLLVNETTVYVNKYHLAANSDFFKTLFFGKNAQEMPKIVIDEDENAVANFERLISLVNSPANAELDDECVEDIIRLANRFLLDAVENRCVKFLMDESEKSAICKFRLAHQCGITGMKNKILQNMTREDFDFDGRYHYDVLSEHEKLDKEAAKELKKRHEELFERVEIVEDE